MHLIITRHGKAEPFSSSGRDFDRLLSERGHRQAEHLAANIKDRFPIDAVVSSDAPRALDTASSIAEAIETACETDPRLRPEEPVEPVLDLIAERSRGQLVGGLCLAGHNPQLSKLVGVLTLGPIGPSIVLKTGMAVVLELTAESAADPAALPGAAVVRGTLRLDG